MILVEIETSVRHLEALRKNLLESGKIIEGATSGNRGFLIFAQGGPRSVRPPGNGQLSLADAVRHPARPPPGVLFPNPLALHSGV
jgi:hypothetical protein